MDEDERSKKLAAGRNRLAKFQKKKKKKRKTPSEDPIKSNEDTTTTTNSSRHFLLENPLGRDSIDESSIASSDLLGSNSDIPSSFSEIDQRSIGTDDLCHDSDTSQLDADVARVELAEARSMIHQLEETLLGKQIALDQMQNELAQTRSDEMNNNPESDGSTDNSTARRNMNGSQDKVNGPTRQEAELRAALEQYNIKIQEFQQALVQRDEVIQQLSANMQIAIESRDVIQAEAAAQSAQLSQYVQTLQDQLKETGETLRNQSGEQMSNLSGELGIAQSQVTALQQNVADKDALMQQLAERYSQKSQELIELTEDREDLRRKNFSEINALQQKVREAGGDIAWTSKEDIALKLQAELDESYGNQIVMMKQQLDEKHKQELSVWKQRYDEMERIAAASSDSNLIRTELENQLEDANNRLSIKDGDIARQRGEVDNLTQKLANLSVTYQKHIADLEVSHKNEMEFVKAQTLQQSGEHIKELESELNSTQSQLNESLTDLEEEKTKSLDVENELAEKALNSSSLQNNLTKEIGILTGELQRRDEEIQDLNKLKDLLGEMQAKNDALKRELESEKQKQPGGIDEAHNGLSNGDENVDCMKELEERHQAEMESLKATMETVYSSQLDQQQACYEHEKSQALVAQLEELQQKHDDEMEEMSRDWENRFDEKEADYQENSDKMKEINDETDVPSQELIRQLQRRLSDEHREVIQDLTQEWDQEAVQHLEALRSKMEDQRRDQLDSERGDLQGQREDDLDGLRKQWEGEHQLDIEALVSERGRVITQAAEMRKKLETVHNEELGQLRAAMQADYDQLAQAREDLQKTKSQTEQSLRQELDALREAFDDLQQKFATEKESSGVDSLGEMDATERIQQLQREVEELEKELTNQRHKLQREHTDELGKLKVYFEQELADTERKWAEELEKVESKGNEDASASKRPDFSHSLMTLTHISDTDSSPPRSPPVSHRDMRSDAKQHKDLELEYQRDLENLRAELENEHRAEIARISLEYDVKHERDLEREKEAVGRRHEHALSVKEMENQEALDELRKELEDRKAREIAKLTMASLGEAARQVEEERTNAKQDYDNKLVEELKECEEKCKQESLKDFETEKNALIGRMKDSQAEELEKLRTEFGTERAALQNESKDRASAQVAHVLAKSSISHAEEMEVQYEEMLKKNDLIAILKQELADTEARTQKLSEDIDRRSLEEMHNQRQHLQEKNTNEIANLQHQLVEEQSKLIKLQEDIKSGEAPEVQAMRENLVQQYDNQLEMIKTTMNDELEALTRTTQQQSAKDLEEMQTKFVSEHEQMIGRFADDQERAADEVQLHHRMDMENMGKQLQWQLDQDKMKALEELQAALEKQKKVEVSELIANHQEEVNGLVDRQEKEKRTMQSDLDEKWKEEKAKMDMELEDGLKTFGDAESLLEQIRENHEQEKARLKEELTTVHMEKFREVTDKLEEEHQKQLEQISNDIKKATEEEEGKRLKLLEEELQAERSAKTEADEKHRRVIDEMNESYQERAERILKEFEEKLQAMTLDSETELESAKLELEEAHRREVLDLHVKLEEERKEEVNVLQNRLTEVTELIGEEHRKEMEDLNAEKEQCVEELHQQLTALQEERDRMMQEQLSSVDGEKGVLDAALMENDEKWKKELEANKQQHQQILQKLLDEINQVQEEKAALIKRSVEKDTILARRERENEESNNLISMLRSDMDRIGKESHDLQQINNHLLQVISQDVRATIATEDVIAKKLSNLQKKSRSSPGGEVRQPTQADGRDPEGAVGGEGDNDPKNASILSGLSDEGFELSQQLAESMFAGPDLDTDGEELITSANSRLHASVEQLLDMIAETTEAVEKAHITQTELLQTSSDGQEEILHLRGNIQMLDERLKDESDERQRLALDLDRIQGLLQGLQSQNDEQEQSLNSAEEMKLQLIVDLETARNAQKATEEDNQRLKFHQSQLVDNLGGKEQELANEIGRLAKENGALKKESDSLQQQAKKNKENFKSQIQVLESGVEEQMTKWDKLMDEKTLENEDLLIQREAADKLVKANKQFLEQQSAEREQEREEFQREISRLEELSSREKTKNYEEEDIRKELQETKEELKSVTEDNESARSQIQNIERDLMLKDETIQELTSQIKELDRLVEDLREASTPLQSQLEAVEKELMEIKKTEEELMHEKEALQKQSYDQLLQLSALQSKLDSYKHDLEEERAPRMVPEEEDDEGKSLMSVTLMQQLEQEQEALDRKENEIKALEEQLDQFRDALLNKEDEISQLNLQLDIANRALRPDEEQSSEEERLQAQNEHLKEQLTSLQEKVNTLLPENHALDTLTQNLLEEKNEEIDELTTEVTRVQEELEDVRQNLVQISEGDEDTNLRVEFEQQLTEKDREIAALQEQIEEAETRDDIAESLVVETLEKVKSDRQEVQKDTKIQSEEELKSLKQMLGVRDREIAHLEAQLVTLQGSPARGKNIQEETVDEMQKEMEDKDLQLMQLKIQVDQAEETLFQTEQQLNQLSALPQEYHETKRQLDDTREAHAKDREELKEKYKRLLSEQAAEHTKEMEGMTAAQEVDWKRIQKLEEDYDSRITGLGRLSPGKTLEQKLDEIKEELIKQHQEHVVDIQQTMIREADQRMEQLKGQVSQGTQLMQERHQHELEEAILRTNRDLMAAHAEEVAKLREDQRLEVERVMAISPANLSQFTDMNQMILKELEIAQNREHISGVGREPSSQADSGTCSGDVPTIGLSDKLQTILSRIKGEGLSLLSLSELRYLHDQTIPRTPFQKGLDINSLQQAWENEKRALLDAMQSLKDLITQLSASQRDADLDGDDWRGELLRSIQQIFNRERDAVRAELSTNVAMSGDQNITEVQLLQRRIREQENFHKSAVEQIYGADRASILGESRDLFGQNQALKEELQRSRQRLTQQLKALEEQSNKREKQLKRQLETMEHKFRQERILVEDMRTSLTVEKEKVEQLADTLQKSKGHVEEQNEQISDILSKVDKQLGEREEVESRLADITAAFEAEKSHNRSLGTTLTDEKKASRSLQEAFETENRRVNHSRNRDQHIIKELHRELQEEKNKLVESQKVTEKEILRSNALSRELEAMRSETVTEVENEKTKFVELRTALGVERSRCQELKTALRREQVQNAQLQTSVERERQQTADSSLQDKSTIAELQGKLDSALSEVLDFQGQIKQLENAIRRLEGVLETERGQNRESLARERAVARQLKSTGDTAQSKLEDVEGQLVNEQEKSARLKAEKGRLQGNLVSQTQTDKDKEAQREREKENEKKKQLERERDKEMERQRQRDHELEHQLDQQKIRSLEEQMEDWKNHAQQTMEELQRLQDKRKYESEEDLEMQRELETELKRSLERHSPAGSETTAAGGGQRSMFNMMREQLESIRQRLQLIAVRENEGLSLLKRMNETVSDTGTSTAQEVHALERTLQEATAELKQIHGALVLQTETSSSGTISRSRLNTRLLNQNAELSNYISNFSEEKFELRRQVSQLEEQLWTMKQRQQQTPSPPRGNRRDLDMLFAEERAAWERERGSTQNALQQSEREIIHLKVELEHRASGRDSDVELLLSNGDIPEHQQHKFQRLYGKYLRAESFRKSLIYQKKYLLLLLGGFQDTEEASLALIAKMGGYPNPSNMDGGSGHSKAFTRFRSAVRVCIAISRLKYLKKKWQRACGTTTATAATLPPALMSQYPPIRSNPSALPNSHHSVPTGATSAPPTSYVSPVRLGSRLGGVSSGSPPVRDRVALTGASNGAVNGIGVLETSPLSSHRSNSHSGRHRERLSMSPHDPSEDAEVSLSKYIRKLENLQERIGIGARRGGETKSSRKPSHHPR